MNPELRTPNSEPTVVALIPAYNEAKNIGPVLEAIKNIPMLSEALVIDDGSIDNTADVAEKAGFNVLRLKKNAGKGAALEAGIKHLKDADIYLFIDADLVGLDNRHIESLINPLINEDGIQMTVGKFIGGRRRTDWAQHLVPNISGQRALKAEVVKTFPPLTEAGFGVEVIITRHVKKSGYKSQEVLLSNITQVMKEEKLGLIKGFTYRLKMYTHIAKSLFKK